MVRLLNRSRMVAIVPSLEGHAPASLILGVSTELYSGSPTPVNSRAATSIRFPGRAGPGERGAQASIFRRSSRCEAEFGATGAENPALERLFNAAGLLASNARHLALWLISSTIWRYYARRNGIECRIV